MTERPVALVTGAAQGIGRATALEFARRGYALSLVDRDVAGLADAARAAGGAPLEFGGDLSDLAFAESAVRGTVERLGRLDVLVNNAAWRELVTMRAISVESWDRTLRICLTAPAFLARWAAEAMEKRGRGAIVNISSINATVAPPVAPAYVAAKGGLDALTCALAALYGPRGIRVVGVAPGAVEAGLGREFGGDPEVREWSEDAIPLRRWAGAEEVARAIAFLAGDEASYISGTTVVVDGGWTHSLMPHRLRRKFDPGQAP